MLSFCVSGESQTMEALRSAVAAQFERFADDGYPFNGAKPPEPERDDWRQKTMNYWYSFRSEAPQLFRLGVALA